MTRKKQTADFKNLRNWDEDSEIYFECVALIFTIVLTFAATCGIYLILLQF